MAAMPGMFTPTGMFTSTGAGWKRLVPAPVLAFGLGLLSALALPPRHWWWLLPFTLGPLLLLLHHRLSRAENWRRRAGTGALLMFAFGAGWELLGLHWVTEAFFVQADRFAHVAWFAVGALALGMALFMAAAGAVFGLLHRPACPPHPLQGLQLGLLVALFQMMRESPLILGGFPWNPLAHVLSPQAQLPLLQAVSLIGVWGLSALVMFWATAPARMWLSWRAGRRIEAIGLGLLALASLAGLWWWGQARLQRPAALSDIGVIVVQPAVPQSEKWRPQNVQAIFDDLLALTRRGLRQAATDMGKGAPRIVIWPESAVPFLLLDSPGALRMIADVLPADTWLFTGALRRAPEHLRRPDGPSMFNSFLVIDDKGRVRLIYDKRRLVPFGEYLPLAWLLRPLGIRQLVPMPRGFFVGRNAGPHRVDALPPFEAFICYEIIFGDIPPGGNATRWLVNVTNDAWFDASSGPWQHLMAARVRAIERGLPLVRAANTGISIVQDGRGRLLRRLPLGRRGVLVARLPATRYHSFFARFDKWQIVLAMMLAMMICAWPTSRCPLLQRV